MSNNESNSYGVDVPVKINIWTRVKCLQEQFNIIRQVKPSILFIQSDGGRNEKEWEIIRENRRMIDEGIDWDCQVYRFYEEKNNGMYAMGYKVYEQLWQIVDRCILLEDDVLPSVSYFYFCQELLEKYKDDQRIECICGFNHLGIYEEASADYFFSKKGAIWGVATWRRTYEERKNKNYYTDKYTLKLLKKHTKVDPTIWRQLNGYGESQIFEGHAPGDEFWFCFNMYAQNRVQIVSKYNMITNVGYEGEHYSVSKYVPRSEKMTLGTKRYDIDFPLNHPQYVMADYDYDKKINKIMNYNYLWYSRFETIVFLLLSLLHGDFDFFVMRVKKQFEKKDVYEK